MSADSTPPAGIKLGVDAYSLRAWGWKAPQLLNYVASLKLDSLQISTGHCESLESAYLNGLRDKAAAARVELDAGIGCICPTSKSWSPSNGTPAAYLTNGLNMAQGLGAKSLRVFLGSVADRQGELPIEKHIEETVKAVRSVRSLALDLGIKIAVENHGDMQARELKGLIEEAGTELVSCCLDTGNPMTVLEDPMLTLEVLGPYATTMHIRDSVVFPHERGAAWQWVTLGDGVIDFKRFVARAKQLCPNAPMQLENITGRPPNVVPFLEQDFWKTFPKARAADFATFLALARKGRPLLHTMVVADVGGKQPPEYKEALKAQQKWDLERGIIYARRELGLGLNGRA